jgi:putative PEP-CTERM system histidine kinase
MTPESILSICAAVFCLGLAVFVLRRDHRSLANRVFALGMLAFAAREVAVAFSSQALVDSEVLRYQKLRICAEAVVPGLWLLYSVVFARANYGEFLKKWRWTLLAAFTLPILLVAAGWETLLTAALLDETSRWVLKLGWSSYVFHLAYLLFSVLILVNLESTLRGSHGTSRWQLKFTLLGLGLLFAVEIYANSQFILFSSHDTALSSVRSAALLVTNVLILVSLVRSRLTPAGVYLSHSFIYGSLTVLIVGVYLLIVGGLAKAASILGGGRNLPLAAFIVLVSLVALAIVLFSGEAQQKFKQFVSRHLQRPKHDYRNVWSTFTQRTGSLVDIQPLCSAIASVVSETYGSPSVSIWLVSDTGDEVTLGGSTALTEERSKILLDMVSGGRPLIRLVKNDPSPIDIESLMLKEAPEKVSIEPTFLHEAGIRFCVPLIAGRELVGLMTLNERVTKEPFTVEDFELLKTFADQSAAALLNLSLSERLVTAKEMEAFQSVSTFFVHDLKNLASRLSLTLQNLPAHYDDPAFRKDLLRVISQSVENIDAMCSRLSPLSQVLELKPTQTDLNALVRSTVDNLSKSVKAGLTYELQSVPTMALDGEQIQKVLVNLILNANEANEDDGEIRVVTEDRNGWAVLSVADNGCGMSRDFMSRSLFKAFQTTKKKGLGIGLFHCKKIVEAHGGKIEVESEVGKGSTFRVALPNTVRNPR